MIPMVLSPMDRVFPISFRIVRDLPYAVVLGAAFMKEHQSTISFREKEGSRPTPEPTLAPFFSHSTNSATSSKDVTATWTAFCAVRSPADHNPNSDGPRHIVPKCFAEANDDSLDQVVDHLRSIFGQLSRDGEATQPLLTSVGTLFARKSDGANRRQPKQR